MNRPTAFAGTDNLPSCPLPLVHLNGTGRETLLEEYRSYKEALRELKDRHFSTTCHARDYYPLGDNAWQEARKTRDQVGTLLSEIETYLETHIVALLPE